MYILAVVIVLYELYKVNNNKYFDYRQAQRTFN